MSSSSDDALAALRFATAQASAKALAARLEADARASIAASRSSRWSGVAAAAADARADALRSARRAAAGAPPPAKRGRPPGRKSGAGRLPRAGAGLTAVVAVSDDADDARPPAWPTSPRALAAAVVAGRRSALAAAAPVAAPPPGPAPAAWPNPRLPPGSSARLTPWPALRVPLPARPLPPFPASDGRRAGRAEPLWWPPPGSGARKLGPGAASGPRLTSGGSRPARRGGPQRDAEAALASSRECSRPEDAIAPSPAPLPRPPPGWGGPLFAVRRSRVSGLGLYILVPAPAGAYLLDYSGTVVRGAGVSDARERAYTDAAAGGWCEGTYMFNCGPALWGAGSGGQSDPSPGRTGTGGAPPSFVVDATQAGSAARFANHSCAPNCVAIVEPPAVAWAGGGGPLSESTAAAGSARGGAAVAAALPRVALYAVRALAPGEELFFEYRLSPPAPGDPELVCGCGAAGCRGVL